MGKARVAMFHAEQHTGISARSNSRESRALRALCEKTDLAGESVVIRESPWPRRAKVFWVVCFVASQKLDDVSYDVIQLLEAALVEVVMGSWGYGVVGS